MFTTNGKPEKNVKHMEGSSAEGGVNVVSAGTVKDVLAWLSPSETAFALAVAVLREQIRKLSADDKNDLLMVIPHLFSEDAEEVEAAQKAVAEILHQSKAKVLIESDVPLKAGDIDEWLAYISNKICTLRKNANLTQSELAEKAGLPQSHICRLEKGQHSPTNKTLQRIADALGVQLGDLDPTTPKVDNE